MATWNQVTEVLRNITASGGGQTFRGPQGYQGPQGPTGSGEGGSGTQGVQGSQGRQGVQGSQGSQGNRGVQGFQGSQGVQGSQGNQGGQGTQGERGVQGVQGIDGSQGTQGSQGNQGPAGVGEGTQGVQGMQGGVGPQGPAGDGSGESPVVVGTLTTGATTITLSHVPANWTKDGYLVVGVGTNTCEVLRITSVAGSVVTVPALFFDHDAGAICRYQIEGVVYMENFGLVSGTDASAGDYNSTAHENAMYQAYHRAYHIVRYGSGWWYFSRCMQVWQSCTIEGKSVDGTFFSPADDFDFDGPEKAFMRQYRDSGGVMTGVLYHDFGVTGRVFLHRFRIALRGMADSKGILASLQQPAEWSDIRINDGMGEYSISISDTQQIVMRNVIIDVYGASGLDLWSALFVWCENLDIENGNGPAIQAAGASQLSVHNFHNEGTLTSRIIDLFDCYDIVFSGTTWLSVGLTANQSAFYIDGSVGRTDQATTILIENCFFGGDPTGALAVNCPERNLELSVFDDCQMRLIDFALGPVRPYPARNVIFQRYGLNGQGVKMVAGLEGVTIEATDAATPIIGTSTGAYSGVIGVSASGPGITGYSPVGFGVQGVSNDTKAGIGGYSYGPQAAIQGIAASTGAGILATGSTGGPALQVNGRINLVATSSNGGSVPLTHSVVNITLLPSNPTNEFILPPAAQFGDGNVLEIRCLADTMPTRNVTLQPETGEQLNGTTNGTYVETTRGTRLFCMAVDGTTDGWWVYRLPPAS